MNRTFEDLGYLSSEIENFRENSRTVNAAEFDKLEGTVRIALANLRSINQASGEAYLVGLGYWVRCIEACEGVVLLAERGIVATSFAALRTAYECLFNACALWRQQH